MNVLKCPNCEGRGAVTCSSCSGTGNDYRWRGTRGYFEKCSVCRGTMQIQCPACHGRPIYQVVNESTGNEPGKDQPEKRGKGGTRNQSLLAVHYLLKASGARDNNTKKSEFASFLTGFSKHTFRQRWSNIHRKADENGTAWEDDMRRVRAHFVELGLTDIVKLIDDDLGSEFE